MLTAHTKGEVIISVKPIKEEEIEKELAKKPSERGKWVWSNKDSVRVDAFDYGRNIPHEKFCFDCYYLINIKAERKTEATVVIPTPDV